MSERTEEEEKVRPNGWRLWSGWLALVAFGAVPAVALNATVDDPSVWAYVFLVPIVLLLGATSFLFSMFGILGFACALVYVAFENGMQTSLLTAVAMYGYFFLIRVLVVEWLWQGTYPVLRPPYVDRLEEEDFSPDYKLGVATFFTDLNWGMIDGSEYSDSILQRQLSRYPSERLKALATQFESGDRIKQFYSIVTSVDEALVSVLRERLGVTCERLDWRNKSEPRRPKEIGKYMKVYRESVGSLTLDGTASLELKPQVWLADNDTGYEVRTEWHLTISREGEIKELFDKTSSVTGAIGTGDLKIDDLMTGLAAALVEVPAVIAMALAPPHEVENRAEA